ncbi:MAG: glycoside hydrolase family 71/99-like protein [Verrucomicrobiota bacterium]
MIDHAFSQASLALLVWLALFPQAASAEPVSREEAYAVLSPSTVTREDSIEQEEGLTGRVMAGYQGWFRAKGDETGMGFRHYTREGKFEPGYCSIDLWPDLSEFSDEERFPTPFSHADGSTAEVFSSLHPKTIDRHFQWMLEYGIDGVFVQRFAVHGAKAKRDYQSLYWENEKLKRCREAANTHGRAWALMYDLSGIASDDFTRLAEDWKNLRRRMELGTDPHDRSYLHLNGKPLIAIWGVGFADDREYDLERCEWLIRLLKNNPEWGGFSIMLGVPYHWREGRGDSIDQEQLHKVLKLADVISPWSVGRYRSVEKDRGRILQHQLADLEWCRAKQLGYLPVLFPGFSWANLKGDASSAIPRRGGQFFWNQFVAAAAAGNQSAYIAMFDEIDEATAIFKCSNDPPVGASKFQTYEGLPSDTYLRLSGEGGRLLRGELPIDLE